jgi:hypothetical protein
MIQVKFYKLNMFDQGEQKESELTGKLFCQIATMRDLSEDSEFDHLIEVIRKAKEDFKDYKCVMQAN